MPKSQSVFFRISPAPSLGCAALAFMLGPLTIHGSPKNEPVAWVENFSSGMSNWWTEGGERTWVEDGLLFMSADGPDRPGSRVATAWCRRPLPPQFELEVDARVVSSSAAVNNMNVFFCYADPAGRPLEETQAGRASANYSLYHRLNGYIATFVQEDGEARVRLRRNPGFELLAEKRRGECRAGVTYRVKIRKSSGEIVFFINDREVVRTIDKAPWQGGLLGLRTFRTRLWWDNLVVRSLLPEPASNP